MFDFISRYVGTAENEAEVLSNETISETGETTQNEEETDEESDVISRTMDWGFLDYVEHLLILSRSDESDDLEYTKTKVIQNSWVKIDEKAILLHKALLIKANKLYKQNLASLNFIKFQDSNRDAENLFQKTLLKMKLLKNENFKAKNIDKIDLNVILKITPDECKQHQEKINKETKLTSMESLVACLVSEE
ncbi:hypothetical protein RS030_2363 [Cryptosporidium xiaoi]|uniref:Uncharacterized protein n=1 Tax=Cryptosporidium xiaoi TaxID=659607 RepID=A0AAV9XVU2_9CRYT